MRERSYAPTVLLGLAGAAVATVASGGKDWARATGDAAGVTVRAASTGSDSAPLALALALVGLAAWGVVLVVRGRVRRLVAAIGTAAMVGVLAAGVDAFDGAKQDAVIAVHGKGATSGVSAAHLTGWYVAALAGAAVCLLAFAVAVVRSPRWPAMGSRYDAPGARAAEPVTDQDMWRALDRGHDPTA